MIRRSSHKVVKLGLDVQFRLRVRIDVIMSWHLKHTRITTCCSDPLRADEMATSNLIDKYGFNGHCDVAPSLQSTARLLAIPFTTSLPSGFIVRVVKSDCMSVKLQYHMSNATYSPPHT
jgi:hypothetical protein